MTKRSAGLLMYRLRDGELEVFLVHPGGPFWARKDAGAWSIPKGEFGEGEAALATAQREFKEETGFGVGTKFLELGMLKQAGGKMVWVWAFEGDCDPATLQSNLFEMEWPPRSGRRVNFPEANRGVWFPIPAARERVLKGQVPFLDILLEKLDCSE